MNIIDINTTSINHNLCDCCGKKFTRKTSYEKHVIICKFIKNTTKREIICTEEETTNIPSISQLYMIIQEMALKQKKMEEKMEEMQKWIDKKKKKINIILWLSTHQVPELPFESWAKSIVVHEEDVLTLMEQSLSSTMQNILRKNVQKNTEDSIFPIASFAQKANVLYMYTNEKQSKNQNECESEKKKMEWIKMETEQYIYLIKHIHSKMLKALCSWRQNNIDMNRMIVNEKIMELYSKTMLKLVSVDFHQESTFGKLRVYLFNHIKQDMTNMIEYDFDFE